jgi:hypothetical protein
VHQDRDDPRHVQQRQPVDEPQHVAHEARDDVLRGAVGAQDAQPRRSLARRAAAAERLEEDVVAEVDDDFDGQVDDPGGESRAQPGEVEGDVEALGRRDDQPVLVVLHAP